MNAGLFFPFSGCLVFLFKITTRYKEYTGKRTPMQNSITILDEAGEIEITYEDMCRYHGRDFFGGVALAFKVLELAFGKLLKNTPPERNNIRIVLGFNPPGVVDALEYATRAVTRQRLILHPNPPKGPESVFGKYYFEVHNQGNAIALWLKEDLLPEDFTMLARKAFAGIASNDELSRWKAYKQQLGKSIISMKPEELLDYEYEPLTM